MLEENLFGSYKLFMSKELDKARPKFLFASIPELGLVGLLALRHMVKKLSMNQTGYILSDQTAMILRYEDGKPLPGIRLYESDNLMVLIMEVPVLPANVVDIGKLLLALYFKIEPEMMIMFGSAPSVIRQKKQIDDIMVLGVPIGDRAADMLKKGDIDSLKNGTLSGPYAYVLNNLLKDGKDALVLLAETYSAPITVDPESSAKLLKVISKMIGIDIDVKELMERAEEIRLEMRKLEQLAAPTVPKEIGQLYT